jgi:hypothetical protein
VKVREEVTSNGKGRVERKEEEKKERESLSEESGHGGVVGQCWSFW